LAVPSLASRNGLGNGQERPRAPGGGFKAGTGLTLTFRRRDVQPGEKGEGASVVRVEVTSGLMGPEVTSTLFSG
jgi:hypothetical protein